MQSRKHVYAICEAAIMITIALVLDYLKDVLPGQLPSGGSVFNINILPIVFFAIRHGAGWGALTGLVFGGLTYLLGLNSMAIDWTTIICDYFLAFSLLGLGAGGWMLLRSSGVKKSLVEAFARERQTILDLLE